MSLSLFSGRKAQMTVFIILGIVMLIGVLVYLIVFYGRGELVVEETRAVEVPLEVKPIKDFVESCAQKIGADALKLAGQHGGYIYPTEMQDTGRLFMFDSADPSSSDGVPMGVSADSGVVYWWYLKSPNKCYNCRVTTENIPKIGDIERQVDKYVQDNLGSCLGGFSSFEKMGFDVEEAGPPVAKTKVTEKDVVVSLDFPLRVSLMNRTTGMSSFLSHIPIDLKKIYSLANEVALSEADKSFLEYITQSWISLNSGLRSGMLPPTYGIENSYVPKVWVEDIVRLQLESLLGSYIPLLQVDGTKGAAHIPSTGSTLEKGMYDSLFLEMLNTTDDADKYINYSVRFNYIGWPIYLHISPNDNGILRAARTTDFPMMIPGLPSFVPIAPQREYEFFYDLSYPVVVEIRNEEDLFGEGYAWIMALEVNLRDNRGIEQWFRGSGTYGPWDYSWVRFDPPKEELAMVEGSENLMLVNENFTKTLFCSPKQRLSGNISVTVKDIRNSSLLEGVTVRYSCGKYASCLIGTTQFDLDLNATLLRERLPVCVGGGIITLEKPGYKGERFIDLSTEVGEGEEFEFEMTPIFVKNVTVNKLLLERKVIYREPLEDHGNSYERFLNLSGEAAALDLNNDSLIINIRKIDEPIPPLFVAQNIIIDNTSKSSSSVKLIPGTYEIQTTYLDTSGVFIAPEKRCSDGDENCFSVPEEPGMELDQIIGGGLTLDNTTGYWRVDWEDLEADNVIEFNVLKLPPPVVVEDMNEMSLITNLSGTFRSELEPRFR